MKKPEKLIEIERPPIVERAILARLALPRDKAAEVEESLAELRQLAWTAGAETVFTVVQHRDKPHPGTLFGAGKLSAMRTDVLEMEADVVIVDTDLSGVQGRKLEEALGCKVVDRTQLILDIFAQRAETREGKYQVELAQLQYLLPRLTGRGSIMRQQGGIGVRGPGEQKLETDRRVIRNRVTRLQARIEEARNTRRVQRKRRVENTVGSVALVGYTNAGKSSLLNALTGAGVLVEDKLFATLDPRVRRCALPSGREILLADTVGFVRKLPHTLVAAFRATLEEVTQADLLLIVIDASHTAHEEHLRAVRQVLEEIEAAAIPMLNVYNKADRITPEQAACFRSERAPGVVVSALERTGLDALLAAVDQQLATTRKRVRLRIPQNRAEVVARLHEQGRVLTQAYEDNSVLIEAEIETSLERQLAEFMVARERGEA